MAEALEPLLEGFWAGAGAGAGAQSRSVRVLNMEEVERYYPNQLIKFVKDKSMIQLGEARIYATELKRLFNERAFATRGSEHRSLDWRADWGVEPLPDVPEPEGGAHLFREDPVLESVAVGTPDRPSTPSRTPRSTHPASRSAKPPPAPSVMVEAYLITVKDAAAPGQRGLLGPLLRRWQLGSCSSSAFGLPAVQAVVQYKWDRFAQRLLLWQLAAYVVWFGSFTGFMILFTATDVDKTVSDLISTWKGLAAVCCQLLSLVAMLPFLFAEVCVFNTYGLRAWLNAWNMLDLGTYTLQILISVLHLGDMTAGSFWLTSVVAAQAVLLIIRLTYFSRVFRSTTFDFMGSLGYVLKDVAWYVGILLLMMWGFAGSFYTIFRDDEAADGFESLPLSMLSMLNYAVGGASFDSNGLLASERPTTALVLCLVYQFVVSMCLMSLLTGVMANALMRANQEEAVTMVLNRAQVIDELETVLPTALLNFVASRSVNGGSCGSHSHLGLSLFGGAAVDQPYVKVLRVNPKSLEQIDGEERLWPSTGGEDGGDSDDGSEVAVAAATQSAARSAEAVSQLHSQVSRMEAQLEALMELVKQQQGGAANGASSGSAPAKGAKK